MLVGRVKRTFDHFFGRVHVRWQRPAFLWGTCSIQAFLKCLQVRLCWKFAKPLSSALECLLCCEPTLAPTLPPFALSFLRDSRPALLIFFSHVCKLFNPGQLLQKIVFFLWQVLRCIDSFLLLLLGFPHRLPYLLHFASLFFIGSDGSFGIRSRANSF